MRSVTPVLDKRPGVGSVLACSYLAMFLFAFPVLAVAAEETVNGLRQAGWTLVEKKERDEWLPGRAPYEDLGRLVYVVTYIFEKDGKTMTCTLARDMMFDTLEQTCAQTK